jgi:thymidylate kinase
MLVIIEGIDFSGKTTITQKVKDIFDEKHII